MGAVMDTRQYQVNCPCFSKMHRLFSSESYLRDMDGVVSLGMGLCDGSDFFEESRWDAEKRFIVPSAYIEIKHEHEHVLDWQVRALEVNAFLADVPALLIRVRHDDFDFTQDGLYDCPQGVRVSEDQITAAGQAFLDRFEWQVEIIGDNRLVGVGYDGWQPPVLGAATDWYSWDRLKRLIENIRPPSKTVQRVMEFDAQKSQKMERKSA